MSKPQLKQCTNGVLWQRIDELQAENARLTLRATAVVEDNYLCTDRKPNATDSYGVNAVLLWLLRKEVSDDA